MKSSICLVPVLMSLSFLVACKPEVVSPVIIEETNYPEVSASVNCNTIINKSRYEHISFSSNYTTDNFCLDNPDLKYAKVKVMSGIPRNVKLASTGDLTVKVGVISGFETVTVKDKGTGKTYNERQVIVYYPDATFETHPVTRLGLSAKCINETPKNKVSACQGDIVFFGKNSTDSTLENTEAKIMHVFTNGWASVYSASKKKYINTPLNSLRKSTLDLNFKFDCDADSANYEGNCQVFF